LAAATPYRLVFITDETYDATSASIATYNSDVTTAAADNSGLPATSWYAIASVPGLSAEQNVTSCAGCDDSVPIYLVDGTFVAGSVADLFSDSASSMINEDQFGDADGGYIWTGSNADGSAFDGDELGSEFPEIGDPGFGYPNEFAWTTFDSGNQFSLYAISGVIDAPEPASASVLALGGFALAAARRRRRRVMPG
jgi:hypothetical protein